MHLFDLQACQGRQICSLSVNKTMAGEDPCAHKVKSLAVQAACAPSSQSWLCVFYKPYKSTLKTESIVSPLRIWNPIYKQSPERNPPDLLFGSPSQWQTHLHSSHMLAIIEVGEGNNSLYGFSFVIADWEVDAQSCYETLCANMTGADEQECWSYKQHSQSKT